MIRAYRRPLLLRGHIGGFCDLASTALLEAPVIKFYAQKLSKAVQFGRFR